MRQYIFRFEQERMVQLGLNVTELLILDYLIRFLSSNCVKTHSLNNEIYFRVSYKKILEDLPILNIKHRQLRYIISNLESKGIIKRMKEIKHYLQIYINLHLLYGNYLPTPENDAENCCGDCNNLPTIDSYDSENKIKIKINNARINSINLNLYNKKLLEILKENFSDLSYELFIKHTVAIKFYHDEITLSVKWKHRIVSAFLEPFTKSVQEAFDYFNL